MIGNDVYYDNTSDYVHGTISGSNISFTVIGPSLTPYPSDFAACTGSAGALAQASIDTSFYCGPFTNVPVSAAGTGVFTWSVINGPAVITGGGDSIMVSGSGNSRILLTSTATAAGPCSSSSLSATDTVNFIIPTANVDAGPDFTITGCGDYTGVLQGMLTNTTAGVSYQAAWTTDNGSLTSGLSDCRSSEYSTVGGRKSLLPLMQHRAGMVNLKESPRRPVVINT